jgi:Ser/Thr protein kinase RdoA (MazF antagonist)
MKPYLELSVGGQFRRIRGAAMDACWKFDIDPVEITNLHHGENTTFCVTDNSGEKHVVRIHRPGYQTFETINSELRFLEALQNETDLNVPRPRKTKGGEHIVPVAAKGVPEERYAVVFNWIDGKFIHQRITVRHMSMTGELTAKLHAFADRWHKPEGFARRNWHEDFHLNNALPRLDKGADFAVFANAAKLIRSQVESYGTAQEFGIIHADLHFGNVFFPKVGIAAIDFDDLGFANYAYDYAVTLSSYRRDRRFEKLRDAYGEGYQGIRPLPADWHERTEQFMAARLIFMIDWFFTRDDNPRLSSYRDKAIPIWQTDLERYLSTGSVRESITVSAA